jgi:hypothetical protein
MKTNHIVQVWKDLEYCQKCKPFSCSERKGLFMSCLYE